MLINFKLIIGGFQSNLSANVYPSSALVFGADTYCENYFFKVYGKSFNDCLIRKDFTVRHLFAAASVILILAYLYALIIIRKYALNFQRRPILAMAVKSEDSTLIMNYINSYGGPRCFEFISVPI